MKKSNVIIFVLLALASAFFLWLWFFLGLNRIDEPLDLVLSIVWWAVIAVAVGVIVKMERTRRRRIRTVYVGDGAAFNSEKGLVKLEGAAPMRETIAGILQSLKYDFERADFPEKDEFEVKYFVRTKEFEAEERKDEASDVATATATADQPAAAAPQTEQKTWKGEVFIVETKEERPFDTPEELASILTSLELEQAA
ncbi:hypothetical protein [Eggerthella sinensis]|uniref:hypothetical protein n=1 Tax=Eggerthella sinensis TaxID=242230 RepID=UPI00248F04FE|nr:hypothetical protein [Eggerthella sinensis]